MWLRRSAYAVASIVGLVILLVAAVYAISEWRFRRTFHPRPEAFAATSDTALIARGAHLTTIIACAQCHGEGMRGAALFNAPPMGRLVAPNLTRGKGGIGAQLTPTVVERAVRHGVGPDGRALRIMPSVHYQGISDEDTRAIIAYILNLPPIDNVESPSSLSLLPRALLVAGMMPLLPAEHIDSAVVHPMSVAAGPSKEYGLYLATISGCRDCHGPQLSGGKITEGDPSWPPAANLTPAGNLSKWTEAQFVSTLRTGIRPDGVRLKLPMGATPKIFGQMTDEELHAIWLYLQSMPPRAYGTH